MAVDKIRCAWVSSDSLYIDYHDLEWGKPVHDDRLLFEMINLEGAQAGLSWITVLKKRARYKEVFDNFEAEKIIHYDQAKIDQLLQDPGIIRNKLKVNGVVTNAKVFLSIQKEYGSFDKYIWQFVNGETIQNKWKHVSEVPAKTEISDLMSKDLKKKGFKFVGSTICYAFMQACGMVNDHTTDCYCH
ncbi:DNA-3-methyladenine glycosylase I [Portibacter lacus]|uniref:DNA-3-methyladenine glycosylase I n=1 Tax=Portibacter lacus TaxID=1099794 RepID=A0AA37SL71_9BACT|nr:DNA-3-methyladenine glycosylase I [Portibacter lacus]GLR15955.1 DNA-3-methyladenine glycosylase I [Portibacter lacus]